MPEPLLNSCCFCQSLKAGTIISGICGILMSIVSIVMIFVARVEFKTILFDFLPSSVVKIILVINLVMTILISILLIIGALRRNHFMLLPWTILGLMCAVGLLISVIYTSVSFLIDGFLLSGLLWLGFGLLAVAVYLYMWCVVFSYFTILKNENDRGKYSRQPYRR